MPPETGTALLILVAFVLPGFVTVLIKERLHDTPDTRTEFDRLLQVAYYSVWSYLVVAAAALVFDIRGDEVQRFFEGRFDDPALLVLITTLVILAPSCLVAAASILWSDSDWVNRVKGKVGLNIHHQTPTAWDDFFDERRAAMVRVVLKDGRLIGGFYGSNSFAAYAKDGRDLYLEKLWQLDPANGWFTQEAPATEGVWIPSAEVVEVEFYTPNPDGEESGQGRAQAPASGTATEQSATEADSPAETGAGTRPASIEPAAIQPCPGPDATPEDADG